MARQPTSSGKDASPKTVTPAAEFRRGREVGELITLSPTGRVVRMRTVKPAHLLRLGKVPDILAELVINVLYGQMTSQEYQEFFSRAEKVEHALELCESLRVVCTAALIEPKVVSRDSGAELADDEIAIDDLEDAEQRIIFDLALLEASALSRFRERQAAGVGLVDDGEGDEQPAEPIVAGAEQPSSLPV